MLNILSGKILLSTPPPPLAKRHYQLWWYSLLFITHTHLLHQWFPPPPLSPSPDPPSILQPPTNISVPLNRSAQFSCIPDGHPDPQISWQFQGAPIAGANGPIYSIAMVTGANGGQYTCMASNAVGRTSATATLTVLCKCLNYWPQPFS